MHKQTDGSSYVGQYCRGQRQGRGGYLFANGDRCVTTDICVQFCCCCLPHPDLGHLPALMKIAARLRACHLCRCHSHPDWPLSAQPQMNAQYCSRLLCERMKAWCRYLGTWVQDLPAGLGCYCSAAGGLHEGEFIEGLKDGWGVRITCSGEQSVGMHCSLGLQAKSAADISQIV